ncbi:unnamed protein product [Diatraea saccharalis]|uniref:BESS domain-containing protein n=1 Tax=Diatraea saccharalis TaxID=40085 RepID=A0A9N9WI50_9NEOP|nr:unnamed protein product [Diatraea saccharalis]
MSSIELLSQTTAATEEDDEEDNNLVQPSTSHTPKPMALYRRRPATDLAKRQMTSAFGQLTNILNKRQNERPPPPQEDDDCDLFSKLLAKKLRELPPDERKLFMYDIDTLFINKIKERLATHQTPSPVYSVPYPSYSVFLPSPSPSPNRPSTYRTSYSEPLRNASPSPKRPSTSQTSYSEPLPIINILDQPSTSRNTSQTYYVTQPDFRTPTINITSNEVIVPPRENIVNEAFLKAYED